MTENADTKTLREGSKAATLLEMLQRQDGATLEEMTTRTGWQSHSVRAAMTGLRKKGHVIEKRAAGNTTAWFVGAAA
jgi:transcription initiation factor IIE alpha subunit